MGKKVLVIHGPNLQLLGKRETDIYGSGTLDEINGRIGSTASDLGLEAVFFQSNHEGEIVDRIGSVLDGGADGIIINPAAYTHTSVAIRDALASVTDKVPAIEVHISNIYRREEFRHRSLTAAACTGQISGLGAEGYELAMRAMGSLLIGKEKAN